MAKLHKPFLAFPLNTLLFSTIAPFPKNEKSGFYKLKDFQYQKNFFLNVLNKLLQLTSSVKSITRDTTSVASIKSFNRENNKIHKTSKDFKYTITMHKNFYYHLMPCTLTQTCISTFPHLKIFTKLTDCIQESI